MLGPLNIGTLDVSKSWEVSVSWEVLQEDRTRRKVMCTLGWDRDRKEKHGLLLNFWQNTQYCYHQTEGGPEHCIHTVEQERNTVKTEKYISTGNSNETQPVFGPQFIIAVKIQVCDLKYIILLKVELCVKHMIWHTCAITIKGTLEGFRQHFSRFALFRFCFSCCVFLQIIIESMCLPSVKVWKNS